MKNLKLFLLSTAILFSSQVFSMKRKAENDLPNPSKKQKLTSHQQKELNKQLFEAIKNRTTIEQIKLLIQAGANVDAKNDFRQTALMIASKYHPEAIKYLTEADANINAKDCLDLTVLMRAATYHPEVVKYLIDYCQFHNIKLNVNAKDHTGWTALMKAAQYHPEAVKYLIDYCQFHNIKLNVNAKDNIGWTAFMYTAQYQPEAVKYLVDYCQSNKIKLDINAQYAWTALMKAARYHPETVKSLINYCQSNKIKLNVNDQNYYGWTSLMIAALFQQPESVKYLALVGADLNQIKDKYPAEYKNSLEGIKKWIFTNYTKDRNKVLSKIKFIALSRALKLIRYSNGNTLLHYATMKEDVQLFGLIYSICPSLIATTNNNNQTPFDLVFLKLANGRPEIFNLLKKLYPKNNNQNQEKENFEKHQSDDDDDSSYLNNSTSFAPRAF